MSANSKFEDPIEGVGGIQDPNGDDQIPCPEAQPGASRLTEAEKKKRKQESGKKYLENKKKKMEDNEQQVKRLKEDCAYYKGKADALEEKMTQLFDEKLADPLVKLGEITAKLIQNCQLHGRGVWGSPSAIREEVAYPPLELSVIAMRSDGSMAMESFTPCQSLPEPWNQLATGQNEQLIRAFFGLKEHYTASTVRYAREIEKRDRELTMPKEFEDDDSPLRVPDGEWDTMPYAS